MSRKSATMRRRDEAKEFDIPSVVAEEQKKNVQESSECSCNQILYGKSNK